MSAQQIECTHGRRTYYNDGYICPDCHRFSRDGLFNEPVANARSERTPGPWKVGTGWIYRTTPTGKPGRRICNIDVAPEDDANARLIAAAPDMLAALALLADEIRTCDDCQGTGKESPYDACRSCGGIGEVFSGGIGSYIEDVRAAIAKAEGRDG